MKSVLAFLLSWALPFLALWYGAHQLFYPPGDWIGAALVSFFAALGIGALRKARFHRQAIERVLATLAGHRSHRDRTRAVDHPLGVARGAAPRLSPPRGFFPRAISTAARAIAHANTSRRRRSPTGRSSMRRKQGRDRLRDDQRAQGDRRDPARGWGRGAGTLAHLPHPDPSFHPNPLMDEGFFFCCSAATGQ
jgi:hypothetical protein